MLGGSPPLVPPEKNPKGLLMIPGRFLFWLCSTHFRDSMQIFIWPIAVISENQTFGRSSFNFFKNSIFRACFYHCYLFKCVDGGVGGRVIFTLAWQPVTNWIPLTAHDGFFDSHRARNGFFCLCKNWLMVEKRFPTHDLTLLYLYFQFVPLWGLISLVRLLPAPRCRLSFHLRLLLFGCMTCSLIIIMASIYRILTMVPGTLQGALYVIAFNP